MPSQHNGTTPPTGWRELLTGHMPVIHDIADVAPDDIVFLRSAADGRLLAFTVGRVVSKPSASTIELYERNSMRRSVVGGSSSWRLEMAIRPDAPITAKEHD